jgi:hypothetical protein
MRGLAFCVGGMGAGSSERGPLACHARMRQIELLVEAYLMAERDLVAVVDAAGGTVPLPDGRTVTVGRAEFDTPPSNLILQVRVRHPLLYLLNADGITARYPP